MCWVPCSYEPCEQQSRPRLPSVTAGTQVQGVKAWSDSFSFEFGFVCLCFCFAFWRKGSLHEGRFLLMDLIPRDSNLGVESELQSDPRLLHLHREHVGPLWGRYFAPLSEEVFFLCFTRLLDYIPSASTNTPLSSE